MSEILKGLGIGAGSTLTLLIVILIIVYFNQLINISNILFLKPLGFIKWAKRKNYTVNLESKINSICESIDLDLFDKQLNIKWIKGDSQKDIFSKIGEQSITVHIVDHQNPNKNIASVLQDYVSMSFIPNLKTYLEPHVVNANEQLITTKIVRKFKDIPLLTYHNRHRRESTTDDIKELFKKYVTLDRKGFYFPCFLRSLSYIDERIDELLLDENAGKEVDNFSNFIYDVATKKPGVDTDLEFQGNLFKTTIILVARKDTLDFHGLERHIERVRKSMTLGKDLIYIAGIGKQNLLNIKRLTSLISNDKQLRNNLNKLHDQEFMLSTVQGVQYSLVLVSYENYYHQTTNYKEQKTKKVIDCLYANIPQIESGDISIIQISREDGIMSKILLKTEKSYIDIIGCCLGKNFERRNKIESELNEKIYFIVATDDIKSLICRALFPFKEDWVKEVKIYSQNQTALIFVEEERVAGALGTNHVNIRLTEDLTGWNIEIKKLESK